MQDAKQLTWFCLVLFGSVDTPAIRVCVCGGGMCVHACVHLCLSSFSSSCQLCHSISSARSSNSWLMEFYCSMFYKNLPCSSAFPLKYHSTLRLGSSLGSTVHSRCRGSASPRENCGFSGVVKTGFGYAVSGPDTWRWYFERYASSASWTFSKPALPCGCWVSR